MFLSGELALEPDAYLEIPYLVQVFDKDQNLVEGWWQDGTVYPDGMITSRSRTHEAPWWWTGDGPTSAQNRTANINNMGGSTTRGEPLPVVPLVGSGVLLIASGVAYYFADSSAATLPDQQTAADLTAARTRTNLLVLASGVGVAGAIGVGVGGVLLHGNGVTIHF